MPQRFRFPLSIAVWATLIGASALLALFYGSFRESVSREHDAYVRLVRHDSLLQRAYRLTWDAHNFVRQSLTEHRPAREAASRLRSIRVELDSVSASLRYERPSLGAAAPLVSAFLDSVDQINSSISEALAAPDRARERTRFATAMLRGEIPSEMEQFRRVKEELQQRFMPERLREIANVDEEIEQTYSWWALLAFGFVLAGVLVTLALRRYELRQAEVTLRMAAGEEQFRGLVEQTQDALIVVQDGSLVYANAAAARLFEFNSFDEMRRGDVFGLIGPSVRVLLLEQAVGRGPGEELTRATEVRSMTQQGRMLDLEVSASVIQWDNRPAALATLRDITGRKMQEREQALLLWEQEALSQIDRRLIGVVDLGRILDSILGHLVNLTKAHWAGVLMRDGQSGRFRWRSMVGASGPMPTAPVMLVPQLQAVLGSNEPFVLQEISTPLEDRMIRLAGGGEEHVISSVWIPLKGEEEVRGLLAVGFRQAHDFSTRELRLLVSLAEKMSIAATNASLYDDLLARERDLEVLSGLRVNAQEEERRRIAREIHDGLGQILTAIKFNVEILEDSISLNEDDRRRIADVKTLLDNVMKEAREISYNLMPSVLDDFGLAPALQLLAERFGAQMGVRVTFVAQGMSERLSGPIEIALYRIVQEALTNAVRHGEATLVAIQAFRSGGKVRLTIEDNGKGMDMDHAMARRLVDSGIGLASMRERVTSFRGDLDIESSPGNGTLITVHIPVQPASEPV